MTPANNSSKHSKEDSSFTRNSDIISVDSRRSNSKSIYVNQRHAGLDFSKWENNDDNNLIPSPYPMKQAGAGSTASLGKNLISRINELSAPVKRRLKFWTKKSFQVNQCDPTFKVIYLGNLGMQLWSKDENCLEKPLSTLWNNYLVNMKTEIVMRLTICNSGLKAITRQHGLTQYWSNRLVYCCSHKNYPRIFSWIYRHEGKKMRQEIRCHAVFCPSPDKALKMVAMLNQRLACALQEFRREKKSHSLSLSINSDPLSVHNTVPRAIPLRRQILAKGTTNFRPPLERSKSAPKLTPIIEDSESDSSHDEFEIEESFGDRDDDEDDDDEDDDEEEEDYVDDEEEIYKTYNQRGDEVRNRGVNSAGIAVESNWVAKSSFAKSPVPELNRLGTNWEKNSTETNMSIITTTNTTTTTTTDSEQSAILNESSANTTASSSSSKTKDNQAEPKVISETSEASQTEACQADRAIVNKINTNCLATDSGNESCNRLEMTRSAGQAKTVANDEDGDATREVIASWSNLVIR